MFDFPHEEEEQDGFACSSTRRPLRLALKVQKIFLHSAAPHLQFSCRLRCYVDFRGGRRSAVKTSQSTASSLPVTAAFPV